MAPPRPRVASAPNRLPVRWPSHEWRVAAVAAAAVAATETAPAVRGDELGTPFMKEMRAAAMRLHSRDQARDGRKEAPMEPPVAEWQPTVEGYLRFLVDSRLVFQTLEAIVGRAAVPWYAEFRDTGLERSEPLRKDLEWFRQQGHAIPEPSAPGITYASFLEELSEKDPRHLFVISTTCTLHIPLEAESSAKWLLRRSISRKSYLFYEWEGDLSQMQQNVRARFNRVASLVCYRVGLEQRRTAAWARWRRLLPTQ